MISGKKIIQIVLFDCDFELLQLRFEENTQVDFFVVITKKDLRDKIKKDNCKILVLPDELSLFDLDFLYKFLHEQISELLCEFENIFILSKENEFVDYENFEPVIEKLKYDSIILKHRVFLWSKKFFSENLSKGSYVFTASQFLVKNNIFQIFDRKKIQETNFSGYDFENGWSLKSFKPFAPDPNKFTDRLVSYENTEDKLQIFTGQFAVPKFFDKLSENVIKIEPKVIFINYSDTKCEDLPQSTLYGSQNYEVFLETYKINELYREIKKKVSSPFDKIVLSYNNTTFEFDYSVLKNKFLSEIINPS